MQDGLLTIISETLHRPSEWRLKDSETKNTMEFYSREGEYDFHIIKSFTFARKSHFHCSMMSFGTNSLMKRKEKRY